MEQIGLSSVGTSTSDGIISSMCEVAFVSAVLPGAAAKTYVAGLALMDSATAGLKAPYYNGGGVTGTACILWQRVVTTASSGNMTCDGLVEGNVKTSRIIDGSGNAVDATFKAALPKVRFE